MKESKMFNFKKNYDVMSKKKRAACLILVITIIMLTVTACTQGEEKATFRNSEFTGITSEGMDNMVDSDDKTAAFRNTTMKIDYLDVYEDVNVSGKISTADEDVKFHFTGDLYVSEKQAQGIEAYVGKIVDRENNFVVNYFEIKNDTSYDLLKYSEENLNKRVISFDLERNGIKYYFELDMDALGVSFNAESITEMAPGEIDFYENYVNEEKSVAPCIIPYDSEENQTEEPGSMHPYSAAGERWYHKQVVDGWFGSEIIYEYYAEPKMEGNIADVGTASSVIWTSKLVFGGYVEKDGVRIDTVDNVFSMEAGIDENDGAAGTPIEFQMYMGENTTFTSGEFDGACKINGLEGNLPHELIVSGVNDDVVCNQQFDDSVSLDKTNHYITFSVFTATIDSANNPNHATNCVVRWNYNMCYQKEILENGSATLEKTINYIANVK